MTDRSLRTLTAAGGFLYGSVVLGTAIGLAQIPGTGLRGFLTFMTVCGAGAAFAMSYLASRRSRRITFTCTGCMLAVATLFVTFLPWSHEPGSVSDSSDSVGPTDAPVTPTPTPPGTEESPSTSASPTAVPVEPRPRKVQVQIGRATVVYGGALRISVQSAYDNRAVMGLFTSKLTCDSLFPDIGRTMVIVAEPTLLYEVTLLASVENQSVEVEVRRRAIPTSDALSCPSSF